MANPEALEALGRGVEQWNEWINQQRKDHGKTSPNLSDADLRDKDLSGVDFREVHLIGAKLSGATLRGAKLSRANLFRVDLANADLDGAALEGANLDTANLSQARLVAANLSQAKLVAAYLNSANLSTATLSFTNMTDANLGHANLNGSNLSYANLSLAKINLANLSRADLSNADLNSATFDRTELTDADLSNAILAYTAFGDVDLRDVKGLNTVKQHGPSTIGIDTIFRSQGKIPESFLRGAGVPDSFIAFMKSLTASAFEFYSAFISYSGRNQDCADRIHSDLQATGVRCWLATEGLKIGDPFRQRIDESIKLHDKLLLILSEHSVKSPWVQDEVEAALERERRDNRLVLFPIRIDDAVMDTTAAWAASIRRTRHIGDFTGWRSHDSYQKAFERLLRDLKADAKDGSLEH